MCYNCLSSNDFSILVYSYSAFFERLKSVKKITKLKFAKKLNKNCKKYTIFDIKKWEMSKK